MVLEASAVTQTYQSVQRGKKASRGQEVALSGAHLTSGERGKQA